MQKTSPASIQLASSARAFLVILGLVVMATVAVVVSQYQQERRGTLAPTAPESQPSAQILSSENCSISFTVPDSITHTPTPSTTSPTNTPLPTNIPTNTPSPTSIPTATPGTGGPTATPTELPSSTPTNTPVPTSTQVPSPTSTLTPSTVPSGVPSNTPSATPTGLPEAGSTGPTMMLIVIGGAAIILGVLSFLFLF